MRAAIRSSGIALLHGFPNLLADDCRRTAGLLQPAQLMKQPDDLAVLFDAHGAKPRLRYNEQIKNKMQA
jgi:hypothetical protein